MPAALQVVSRVGGSGRAWLSKHSRVLRVLGGSQYDSAIRYKLPSLQTCLTVCTVCLPLHLSTKKTDNPELRIGLSGVGRRQYVKRAREIS